MTIVRLQLDTYYFIPNMSIIRTVCVGCGRPPSPPPSNAAGRGVVSLRRRNVEPSLWSPCRVALTDSEEGEARFYLHQIEPNLRRFAGGKSR